MKPTEADRLKARHVAEIALRNFPHGTVTQNRVDEAIDAIASALVAARSPAPEWRPIAKEKRAADMPDERSAINALWQAQQRLKELGWNDAIYCPKDGSQFEVIELGSTGIHRCVYQGEWPKGTYWILENGDMSPSHPILFRTKETT